MRARVRGSAWWTARCSISMWLWGRMEGWLRYPLELSDIIWDGWLPMHGQGVGTCSLSVAMPRQPNGNRPLGRALFLMITSCSNGVWSLASWCARKGRPRPLDSPGGMALGLHSPTGEAIRVCGRRAGWPAALGEDGQTATLSRMHMFSAACTQTSREGRGATGRCDCWIVGPRCRHALDVQRTSAC
jgi:hypothetical protein